MAFDDGARPLPPHLDPRAGRSAHPAAPGRGGSRLAVVARVVAALLSLALLLGSGWGWYLARVAEASIGRTDAIPTEGNTDAQGSDHAGKAMNLLLVGRDSRAGLTAEQAAEFSTGDPEGLLNTDTMILVHIPADGSAAAFVSIPRDLYVSIPGYGESKLNSAFGRGYNDEEGSEADKEAAGARLLIQTISGVTGVQIDHFAEINLLGFINISSIVGGVEVNLCNATDDPLSGAHFEAGEQTISGAEALAFVRQRHGLPSELDRQVRQQVFLAGLIRNVLSQDLLLNPVKQRQVIQQVGTSVTVDQGLNLFDLAAQMQSVKPDEISFQTIPGLVDARTDAGDVLEPADPDALKEFFASLSAGADPDAAAPSVEAADPADVTVSVLNGSGVSGAAATAADALAAAGFDASSGGNAAATDVTTVSAATGDEALAAAVAAEVPGAAVTVDDSLASGTVQLVLGADSNGIGQPVSAKAPETAPGTYASSERTAEDTSCIA
ncbi:Cell envelope-related transcriptional attenuator [Modestobacter italicus]|uniref:Cell envelope-related transcriptional attenuator n=1 Tax=Modestobacter italicus (strain DSM 44449 / CECT 9708 / BC 501) TaxID=2732864 RepID=I4EQI4_MODI5|nr:LCP family protein [Modestobacter marinus]CCH85647.1 Cell envelope-related transcriptional attenuator [Modestobacter marinus]